ncbi:hypothetical protein [Mycobacterium tuberculosis]|uniref:hypothetical protein n=1 Tax=Mycobacterium tuberculosis TaxID=1773 RepID=UPI00272AAE38|nr:hypothetical protein [Mycobacterium tuberculosis]
MPASAQHRVVFGAIDFIASPGAPVYTATDAELLSAVNSFDVTYKAICMEHVAIAPLC